MRRREEDFKWYRVGMFWLEYGVTRCASCIVLLHRVLISRVLNAHGERYGPCYLLLAPWYNGCDPKTTGVYGRYFILTRVCRTSRHGRVE